ncbi:hypothetical protein P9112_000212 [Eukaryota sp. TZLM1-RC]
MTSVPNFSPIYGLARKASLCEEVLNRMPSARPAPTIIAIAGGTASGKTTLCRKIVDMLGLEKSRVAIISQDSFYKVLSEEERNLLKQGLYNFDSPDAFDKPLFIDTLARLREGKAADIPTYDYTTSSRAPQVTRVELVECVLVEGILTLAPEYVHLYDMKLFVDTDSDVRLARRIRRDTAERGRSVESVLTQYITHVKPSYDQYVKPCKRHADLVIPWGAENKVAVKLITRQIQHVLNAGSLSRTVPERAASRSSHSSVSDDPVDIAGEFF